MSRLDRDRLALGGIFLADDQEIGSRRIGRVAVIADIRVNTALLVIHADGFGVARFPHHLIRQHTVNRFTIVDGNDLLQADIGTQCGKISKSERIAVR